MPRTPEETRALFDRWALTYDVGLSHDSIEVGPLAGYAESLAEAAALVTVSSGQSLLDIGIGTGAFSSHFVNTGAQINGVDPSNEMLRVCQDKFPGFQLANGSFSEIPVAHGAVDVAISSFAFHEVPLNERASACRELARVVRTGGSICLLDVIFASPASQDAARIALGPRWDEGESYLSVGELDMLVRGAGFTNTFWRQTAPCHWAVLARRV